MIINDAKNFLNERILVELPVEGRIALFKEGLYFEKPLNIGTEKAVREVEAGSLAYWPMANSICIFYEKAKPIGIALAVLILYLKSCLFQFFPLPYQ